MRLFAIWFVVLAIRAVGIGQALQSQSEQRTMLPYVFAALYFVVAVLLWLFPMLGPQSLYRAPSEGTMSLPSSQVVLVPASSSACGSSFLGHFHLWRRTSHCAAFWIANGQKRHTDAARHIDGLVDLAMLGVGLVLVLKAGAVAA